MLGSRGRHVPAHARRNPGTRTRAPARADAPGRADGGGGRTATALLPAPDDADTARRAAPPLPGGVEARVAARPTRRLVASSSLAVLESAAEPEVEPPLFDRRPRAHDDGPVRGRAVLRGVARRDRSHVAGGAQLRLLVLGCTDDDTTAVDIASGALLRLRIPWPVGHEPDLAPFDVVEATLADDPERDDLAQPEAATAASLPRLVGSLRGRRARRMLARLEVTPHGPLLGFLGPSAPYWEFRGLRPSIALVQPSRGPQLIRRRADGSTWVRFGWNREDVWLPVEDRRTVRALDASRKDRLSGKPLATALGFTPQYVLAAVSSPRDGHCYKVCTAVLPRG